MERACCGLQASPLSCFMQSRSAGCGRNAQAHSVPLSKAFLEDKLATPALLRLILTKHRPPRGEERLQVAEDPAPGPAGGAGRAAGLRAQALPCGAAGGVRRPQPKPLLATGSPKGARGAPAPPALQGFWLWMHTHAHTQAAVRRLPGPRRGTPGGAGPALTL